MYPFLVFLQCIISGLGRSICTSIVWAVDGWPMNIPSMTGQLVPSVESSTSRITLVIGIMRHLFYKILGCVVSNGITIFLISHDEMDL